MRRMRTTTLILFMSGLGGLVSGVLVSLAAVVLGPDALPVGALSALDVLLLACIQGVYVGTPLGLLLGPLAYMGVGQRTAPGRLAMLTSMATIGFGIAFATVGGAPAGLAGGVVGFYGAAVLAGLRRTTAPGATTLAEPTTTR